MYIVLSMTMFPQIAVLGGLFLLLRQTGLFNTHLGLILTYLLFTLPFTVWVLVGYFRGLPRELEEAAYVDGATPLQTLLKVMLPSRGPASSPRASSPSSPPGTSTSSPSPSPWGTR